MTARIYRPARTATQSGSAKASRWLLEFEPEGGRHIEPLMGWTSSSDMNSQVRMWFSTRDEAVAYAIKAGVAYRVDEPKDEVKNTKIYSDNFKFNRVGQWTH